MIATTLTITLGWWILPAVLTLIFGYLAFKPEEQCGGCYEYIGDAIGAIFKLLWLIPLLISWLIYFIIF